MSKTHKEIYLQHVSVLNGAEYFAEDGVFTGWDDEIEDDYSVPVGAGNWAYESLTGEVVTVPAEQVNEAGAYRMVEREGETLLVHCQGDVLALPVDGVADLFDPETGTLTIAGHEGQTAHDLLARYAPVTEGGVFLDPANVGKWTATPATDLYDRCRWREDMAAYAEFLSSLNTLNRDRGNVLRQEDGFAFSALLASLVGLEPEQVYGTGSRENRELAAEDVPGALLQMVPEGEYHDEGSVRSLGQMFQQMGGESSPMARLGRKMLGHHCPLELEDVSLTICPHGHEGLAQSLYDFVTGHEDARQLEVTPFGNYRADTVTMLDVDGVEMLAVQDFAGCYIYAWPGTSQPRLDRAAEAADTPEGPVPGLH